MSKTAGGCRNLISFLVVVAVATAAVACRSSEEPAAEEPAGEEPAGETSTAATTPTVRTTPDGTSADRMLFWATCGNIIQLTDEDLDRLSGQGVDGFVCNVQRIAGLGGDNRFTGDPTASLAGPAFDRQRQIRDSDIVRRAGERGMVMFLSFYAANATNQRTPFVEWFDDAGWEAALAGIGDLAGAAHQLGVAGLALDQELYPETGDATWRWDYPGSTRDEEQVRSQATLRGAQVMQTILEGFPAVEVLAYDTSFPATYEEVVEEEVNGVIDAFDDDVHVDFWDGMTSVDGYAAIWFLNALFYKITHTSEGEWDAVFEYEYNRLASVLSQEFSNWAYASERVFASPFLWISAGETNFEVARSPDHVAEQLEAYSEWAMGGMFANYAYHGVEAFDYTPYADAMRAWTAPRVVDDDPPSVTIDAPSVSGTPPSASIRGTATDDHAVWSVLWEDGDGNGGAAVLDWEPGDGDFRDGFDGVTQWRIDDIPLGSGTTTITITVSGIKGPSEVREVVVEPG